MILSQLVSEKIAELKRLDVSQLCNLPSVSEQKIRIKKKIVQVCTFRESSHEDRTIVIVKCFESHIFWSNAIADGFAITSNNVIVELDENERATLY